LGEEAQVNSQTAPASDEAFRRAFERCTIPNEAFRHRDHIRLAWIYLRDSDLDGAITRITESIRRYADHHGASGRYHETLTQAWARIVALAIAATPRAASVDELLAAHPHLLDKGLPLRHFSGTLLWSDAARRQWVEPDLRPFPGP
jgi:hypothetical protein